MERTKICPVCKKSFSYPIGKGTDRKHCSPACRATYRKILRAEWWKNLPPCAVDGCEKPASRVNSGLCEMHYGRQRRSGTFEAKKIKGRYVTGAGYIKLLLPGHPLADSKGHLFEHRKVAFEANEGKPLQCFWCGCTLDWQKAVVDHLNENKQDNRIENLVVSCNDCNRARGAMLPFIERMRDAALNVLIDLIKNHHNIKTAREDGGFGRARS